MLLEEFYGDNGNGDCSLLINLIHAHISLSIPDHSASQGSFITLMVSKKKRVSFVDVWCIDMKKQSFDSIGFSQRTAERGEHVSFLTPIDHEEKF